MSAVWDRDAAREALDRFHESGAAWDVVLDALEECVRPTPQQTIDRGQLLELLWLDEGVRRAYPGPGPRHALGDRILALVRTVNGVVLTPEEAFRVLRWKRAYDHRYGASSEDDGLDIRLGAAP